MNKEPIRSRFFAVDFTSENAVRSVFGRRGADIPQSPPTEQANGQPAKSAASPSASGRPLRRWSVAELIARAAAAPAADNLGHC
jgi:hypothetical protein